MTRKDYTIDLLEGLDLYDRAVETAQARLEEKGLIIMAELPDTEYFDGRLPSNTSSLNSRELGELLSHCTTYNEYIETQLKLAQVALRNADQKLSLTKAKIRRSKGGTLQDKEDDTISDARYVEANAQWLEAKTYLDLLEAMSAASAKNLKTISRLISVREQELEHGRRAGNVGSRRLGRKRGS
jgi:hypothetical protein